MGDPALSQRAHENHTSMMSPEGEAPSQSARASSDMDGDGIPNHIEREHGLNPAFLDTDGDKKSDGDEGISADRDGDGIIDALESSLDDRDLDGVPDEYDAQNTDPDNDSDGDGYGNGLEQAEGTNPLDAHSKPADQDNDGIPDNIDADKKPIAFVITKKADHIVLEGSFSDVLQIHVLQKAIEHEGIALENGVMMQDRHLQDNGAIQIVQNLIPKFIALYCDGLLQYKDGAFEISGEVHTQEEKKFMDAFVAENAGLVRYINITRVKSPTTQPVAPTQHDAAEANTRAQPASEK
jgi:hypothetical protein